jgi:uncharacterized protein YbbC (DUF1343 family)
LTKNRFNSHRTFVVSILACFCMLFVAQCCAKPIVKPGIDVLLEDSLSCLKGKIVGLVTNQTGIDRNGRSTINLLAENPDVNLIRLFAPEHGIDGTSFAGQLIDNVMHQETGLQVSSLYHGSRTIAAELLAGLDVIIFDIQDIGVRPYTFVSTMAEVMRAAGKSGVRVLVLDRPNPLGGNIVSGLMLDPAWSSFIGPFPVPYLHGMTTGELARLFRGEYGLKCDLQIIPMSGWSRAMTFGDTGLIWIPTSPNVPTWETAWGLAISGALGELGTVSEGVGTTSPFLVVGHPDLNSLNLAADLNAFGFEGINFIPLRYGSKSGNFAGQICSGVRLVITDAEKLNPGKVQLSLMDLLNSSKHFGDRLFETSVAKMSMFDKAIGSDRPRLTLISGNSINPLIETMAEECRQFRVLRENYLIYPEEK